jgi:thiol-disulfide isomerase/thioredoxin
MTRIDFHRRWRQGAGIAVMMMACILRIAADAPANDNFANATAFTGVTNFFASNVEATTEPGEGLHAGEPATKTLWWKWTAPHTGTFRVVTSNSFVTAQVPLDTVVAVYTGDTVSNLTQVVANDDTIYGEFGAVWSRAVFRAYAGETFMIAVGSLANAGTIRFDVNVGGPFMQSWQVLDLQGQPVYWTNFLGKVVMIDFWETICGACVEELPDLIRVQEALQDKGFTIFGLSGDTKVQLVIDYVNGRGINYPIAMSTPDVMYTIYGNVVGYPTKFFIDQEGRNVALYQGGNTQKYYRSIIEPLLRSNSQVRMSIARVGASIRIRWPAAESAFVLQGASSPLGAWTDVTAERVVVNSELWVTLPGSDAFGFYRLIKR